MISRFKLRLSVFALLLAVQWEGRAVEEEDGRSCLVFASESSWNCSASFRFDILDPRLDASLPAVPLYTRTALINWNLFGKHNLSEELRFTLDADVYSQRAWTLKSRDLLTSEIQTSESSFLNGRSETNLGLNEIYFLFEPSPAWQLSVGKKRLIWGTGFASNPTDVLNPNKDLLDPTNEKRGSWIVSLENLREGATYSIFAAPGVIENHNTIPTQVLNYRADSDFSSSSHYIYGVRSYHLIGESDLNFMLFNSHRYKDEVSHQLKAGVSWSQSFAALSDGLTGFGELLAHQSSARTDKWLRSRAQDDSWYYKALVGIRYDFVNESALVLELFRQSDGDSRNDFATRIESSNQAQRSRAAMETGFSPTEVAPSDDVSSRNGRSVSALAMKNYLFLNYQRYKVTDDLLISWSMVHNLHDASGYTGPSVVWSPSESIVLTFNANTDFKYMSDAAISVPSFRRIRETDINPLKTRYALELKSFF